MKRIPTTEFFRPPGRERLWRAGGRIPGNRMATARVALFCEGDFQYFTVKDALRLENSRGAGRSRYRASVCDARVVRGVGEQPQGGAQWVRRGAGTCCIGRGSANRYFLSHRRLSHRRHSASQRRPIRASYATFGRHGRAGPPITPPGRVKSTAHSPAPALTALRRSVPARNRPTVARPSRHAIHTVGEIASTVTF